MKRFVARALRVLRPLVAISRPDQQGVLLFATTAIGDSVMISSCVRYLGECDLQIHLVGSQNALQILGAHGAVKSRILYRRGWLRALALIPSLWRLNCARALVLHVSDSAAWLLGSVAAAEVGVAGRWLNYQAPSFAIRWIDDGAVDHIAEKHCVIASNGLGLEKSWTLRNQIFSRVDERGFNGGRRSRDRTIGLVPGAQNFYKCWPVHKFAELGVKLSSRGYEIVIFGTDHESDLINALCSGVPPASVFVGDLDAVFDRLETLCCLVTNDTGLMHIADALGCPVVALFAATPAFLAAPLDAERSSFIQKPVTCYPSLQFRISSTTCYNKSCRNPICMDQISVDEVFTKVLELDARVSKADQSQEH